MAQKRPTKGPREAPAVPRLSIPEDLLKQNPLRDVILRCIWEPRKSPMRGPSEAKIIGEPCC